ncbi:type III pantothenate kinase [Bacillus sp. SL00103]
MHLVLPSQQRLIYKSGKPPRIEIVRPDHIVEKNTISAMQSGILYGYVGQVEGIVKRMKQQAKQTPKVIATGGLSTLIGNESRLH